MAASKHRTTRGQSLVVTPHGGNPTMFRSELTPKVAPSYSDSRPFWSMNVLGQALTKEDVEIGVKGDQIVLHELPTLLSALFGDPVMENVGGGLVRRTWVNSTSVAGEPHEVAVCLGTGEFAQGVGRAVASDLGMSVSMNGGTASISGKLIGADFDTDVVVPGTPVQELTVVGSPTEGTFTLALEGVETGPIARDASADTIEDALAAVLGAGVVTVTGTGTVLTDPQVVRWTHATGPVAAFTTTDSFDNGGVVVSVIDTGDVVPVVPGATVQPGQFKVTVGTTIPTVANPHPDEGNGVVVASFDTSVAGRWQPFREGDGAGPGPSAFLTGEPKTEVKVWQEANRAGLASVTRYRADQAAFVAATAYRGDGQGVTVLSKVSGGTPDDFGDESGAFGCEWSYTAVHEESWGGAQVWSVTTLDQS